MDVDVDAFGQTGEGSRGRSIQRLPRLDGVGRVDEEDVSVASARRTFGGGVLWIGSTRSSDMPSTPSRRNCLGWGSMHTKVHLVAQPLAVDPRGYEATRKPEPTSIIRVGRRCSIRPAKTQCIERGILVVECPSRGRWIGRLLVLEIERFASGEDPSAKLQLGIVSPVNVRCWPRRDGPDLLSASSKLTGVVHRGVVMTARKADRRSLRVLAGTSARPAALGHDWLLGLQESSRSGCGTHRADPR